MKTRSLSVLISISILSIFSIPCIASLESEGTDCETINGQKICSDDLDRSKLEAVEKNIDFIFDSDYDSTPYFQDDNDFEKTRKLEQALRLTKAGYDNALDMYSEQALSLHKKIRERIRILLLNYLNSSDFNTQLEVVKYIKFFDEDTMESGYPIITEIIYRPNTDTDQPDVDTVYEALLENDTFKKQLHEGVSN